MFAKTVPVAFGKKQYHLAYNAWAMFRIQDLSEEKEVMEILAARGIGDFSLFCKAAGIMSEAAERIRRYEGEREQDTLAEEEIFNTAQPIDILELKRAMLEAVAYGYGRELGGEEEIDLGLAELQKKTG
ncbi:MAG: hypothetical protein HFI67_12045 [Lachnospiraceae bacterium]|jgi:hypothetical protein|nr:hypothetical protein [Lachnospiraceae bacterium]